MLTETQPKLYDCVCCDKMFDYSQGNHDIMLCDGCQQNKIAVKMAVKIAKLRDALQTVSNVASLKKDDPHLDICHGVATHALDEL